LKYDTLFVPEKLEAVSGLVGLDRFHGTIVSPLRLTIGVSRRAHRTHHPDRSRRGGRESAERAC